MKIAFLSNYTTEFVIKEFGKKLKENGIEYDFYIPGFSQYIQEILGENNSFYNFKPDVIFLSIDLSFFVGDLLENQFEENESEIFKDVETRFNQLLSLVEKLREKAPTAQIFIDNYFLSAKNYFKTLEGNSPYGLKNIPAKLNIELEKFVAGQKGVRVIDLAYLIQFYGEKELTDARLYYLTKSKWSKTGAQKIAELYLSHIKAYKGLRKKVIVLDLDNTLWGGVVGQDGVENIFLSNDGPGKAFYDFQKELLKLYKQGILLAVCSKNSEDIAMEAIKNHPYMVLRPEYFAAMRINWENKAQNIKSMAKELNLGTDSFIFLDDYAFERGLVKDQLPEVEVPDLPEDPLYYVDFLKSLDFFNFHTLTDDDFKRNKSYAANKERKKLEESFTDTSSYLRSLNMEVIIKDMDDFSFPRIVQLIQKTNQYNLTTRRHTESDVRGFVADPNYRILEMTVKDKFGDYGIVAAAILKYDTSKVYIDTFLMSCRVLGRGVETAFLSFMAKAAEEKGIKIVEGEVIPTPKNEPSRDMYKKHNFTQKNENFWELNLEEKKIEFPEYIKLVEYQAKNVVN